MFQIKCPLCCNETFTNTNDLKCHLMKMMTNLICNRCNMDFNHLHSFIDHLDGCDGMKIAETEAEFFCQLCNTNFIDINEHLQKSHNGAEIVLENDGESKMADRDGQGLVKIEKFWLDDNKLDLHHENGVDDSILELYECNACNQIFTDLDEQVRHECIPNKVFECMECSTTFPTMKGLKLHQRTHKTSGVEDGSLAETFVCTICGNMYDAQCEAAHMASHSGAASNLNCHVCNKQFTDRQNLDMHVKVHLNRQQKFTCSFCKKSYLTYDALTEHLAEKCTHKRFACRFCGRRFTHPYEKVKHELIHTGEKPHVCLVCGKAFRVRYCLTVHMRTHSGQRPYGCQHCTKRFKSRSSFKHHLRIHSDARNYNCPFCPKAFKTSVQLAGHKNTHIKPFSCMECNRPFATLYAVRLHMISHGKNNSLKYECWMCGASYSRTFAFKDHLRECHATQIGDQMEEEEEEEEIIVGVTDTGLVERDNDDPMAEFK